jgi:hypothetical protein
MSIYIGLLTAGGCAGPIEKYEAIVDVLTFRSNAGNVTKKGNTYKKSMFRVCTLAKPAFFLIFRAPVFKNKKVRVSAMW